MTLRAIAGSGCFVGGTALERSPDMLLHLGTRRTHIAALALVALWAVILILVYLHVRDEPSPSTPNLRDEVRVIQVQRFIQPMTE